MIFKVIDIMYPSLDEESVTRTALSHLGFLYLIWIGRTLFFLSLVPSLLLLCAFRKINNVKGIAMRAVERYLGGSRLREKRVEERKIN